MITLVYLCLLVVICFPLLTRVYLCLPVYSCFPMFTRVLLCLPLFSCACLPIFTHVYSCLPMFTHVYLCLPMFSCVNLSLPIFTHVYMFTIVYSCLFIYVYQGCVYKAEWNEKWNRKRKRFIVMNNVIMIIMGVVLMFIERKLFNAMNFN